MKYISVIFIFTCFFLFSGCAKQISRIEPDIAVDLSGRFNDTDAKMIADELIQQMMNAVWYKIFSSDTAKLPVIIIGHVRNMTFEHISIQTFVKQLERAMLISGKIEIVASRDERMEIREERTDQIHTASLTSGKDFGMETGADFMLKGVLSSILDEEKGKKIVFYQCDMNVIEIKTGRIVWAGQKKIKKYIVKPLFSI